MNGSVRQQHIGNSFSVTLSCCTKCFLGPNWGKHCRGEIFLTRESQRRKTIFYREKTVIHWSRHSISYGQWHRAINSLTRNLKTCALFVVNLLWFSKMSPLKTVLNKLIFLSFCSGNDGTVGSAVHFFFCQGLAGSIPGPDIWSVEVSLSKSLKPKLLVRSMWLSCMATVAITVWVCVWMDELKKRCFKWWIHWKTVIKVHLIYHLPFIWPNQ